MNNKTIGATRYILSTIYSKDAGSGGEGYFVRMSDQFPGNYPGQLYVKSEDYEALRQRFERACGRVTELESAATTDWQRRAEARAKKIDQLRISLNKIINIVVSMDKSHDSDEIDMECRKALDIKELEDAPPYPVTREPNWKAEIEAVLNNLGKHAVRVREGGGPENLAASLAVTCAKLDPDRLTDCKPVAWRWAVNSPYEKHARWAYASLESQSHQSAEPLYLHPPKTLDWRGYRVAVEGDIIPDGWRPSRGCHANMWADPPQDCDAPFCGCNPAWSQAIEMLQECGWKSPEEFREEAADFKNFHRLLCERFGVIHDERHWKRDQLSLVEFIAKRIAAKTEEKPMDRPTGPREPNNDMVICPCCTSQFKASPVNIQNRLEDAERRLEAVADTGLAVATAVREYAIRNISRLKKGEKLIYATPEKVLHWAVDSFGPIAKNRDERAARLVEEAIEVAQAEGLPIEVIKHIADRIYSRPPGALYQEVGGVGITLYALAANLGLDLFAEIEREWERVLSKPKDWWQQKHAEKVAAGTANLSPAPETSHEAAGVYRNGDPL